MRFSPIQSRACWQSTREQCRKKTCLGHEDWPKRVDLEILEEAERCHPGQRSLCVTCRSFTPLLMLRLHAGMNSSGKDNKYLVTSCRAYAGCRLR